MRVSRVDLGVVCSSIFLSLTTILTRGANVQIPFHWNLRGQSDMEAPIWLVSLIFLSMIFGLAVLKRGSGVGLPQKARKDRYLEIAIVFSLLIQTLVFYLASNPSKGVVKLAFLSLGALMVAVGNFYPKDHEIAGNGLLTSTRIRRIAILLMSGGVLSLIIAISWPGKL